MVVFVDVALLAMLGWMHRPCVDNDKTNFALARHCIKYMEQGDS